MMNSYLRKKINIGFYKKSSENLLIYIMSDIIENIVGDTREKIAFNEFRTV